MSRPNTRAALLQRSRPIRPLPPTRRGRARASCVSRARRSSRTRSSAGGAPRRARLAQVSQGLRPRDAFTCFSQGLCPRIPGTRLGDEQVRASAIGRAEELHGGVALAEGALERGAASEPPLEGELRVARLQVLERSRNLKKKMRRALRLGEPAGAFAVGAEEIRDTLAFRVLERRRLVFPAK